MSMQPIDLRSDTVTRPDAEMRRAMAEAEVGDDVYGEDPTVRRLEERAAAELGMEAALFLPSGTMGNQVALHLLGRPGGEVVAEADGHVLRFEMGAMAAISGLLPRPVRGEGGILSPQAVAAAINPELSYISRSVVLALENTHNLAGGAVMRPERQAELVAVARSHGLAVHLDGARLFNAAAALDVAPAGLTIGVDTVMLSLSKGLGAPVGSLLAARAELVGEARRVRKMLGGGMRQAGILAAAAIVGLARGVEPLARDHANARRLAEGLAELPGLAVDPAGVETNIVMASVTGGDAPAIAARWRSLGVLVNALGPALLRLVTHRDVATEDVETALGRLRSAATIG